MIFNRHVFSLQSMCFCRYSFQTKPPFCEMPKKKTILGPPQNPPLAQAVHPSAPTQAQNLPLIPIAQPRASPAPSTTPHVAAEALTQAVTVETEQLSTSLCAFVTKKQKYLADSIASLQKSIQTKNAAISSLTRSLDEEITGGMLDADHFFETLDEEMHYTTPKKGAGASVPGDLGQFPVPFHSRKEKSVPVPPKAGGPESKPSKNIKKKKKRPSRS